MVINAVTLEEWLAQESHCNSSRLTSAVSHWHCSPSHIVIILIITIIIILIILSLQHLRKTPTPSLVALPRLLIGYPPRCRRPSYANMRWLTALVSLLPLQPPFARSLPCCTKSNKDHLSTTMTTTTRHQTLPRYHNAASCSRLKVQPSTHWHTAQYGQTWRYP